MKKPKTQTKICTQCGKRKRLDEFTKATTGVDGKRGNCKICHDERKKEHRKKYPWKVIFRDIKARCENPKNNSYEYYGAKGIRCLITLEELKSLWFRDKAYNLNRPSTDRKEVNGDYTLENCQFIELVENIAKDKRKPVLQFDLNGNFIREFKSIINAAEKLNIGRSGINKCCLDILKTSASFKWRYK